MHVGSIPDEYTHIYYAFGGITKDFKVDMSRVQGEFEAFKRIKNKKRILSFGGWSFSTEADTYPIFRQGVTEENRITFANNVVQFIKEHDLDGVDFDWEYPGAPDIPGVPPGSKDDGKNYIKFLQFVCFFISTAPGKTVSVAVPASYWYLRGFDPLDEFAKLVDYVIYMTYDLHGQWDYGNKWSSPGCPGGNCLRSHVNITETMNALTMITKAGMPSNKVIVGVSSYGRSFQMATPGCYTENCLFTGPASGAEKGRCTDTAGYISDFEINEIAKDPSKKATIIYDKASDSNIMYWNSNQWVAYMNEETKEKRTLGYQFATFGGISD